MTKTQIFFKIILLQVIKRIIPPMSNEVITLTKDTALARIIGLAEIIMCAERFTKQGLIWPLLIGGIILFITCNRIILKKICVFVIPRTCPASYCPLDTLSIPPR